MQLLHILSFSLLLPHHLFYHHYVLYTTRSAEVEKSPVMMEKKWYSFTIMVDIGEIMVSCT